MLNDWTKEPMTAIFLPPFQWTPHIILQVRLRSAAELEIFKERWSDAVDEDECWTDPYPEKIKWNTDAKHTLKFLLLIPRSQWTPHIFTSIHGTPMRPLVTGETSIYDRYALGSVMLSRIERSCRPPTSQNCGISFFGCSGVLITHIYMLLNQVFLHNGS